MIVETTSGDHKIVLPNPKGYLAFYNPDGTGGNYAYEVTKIYKLRKPYNYYGFFSEGSVSERFYDCIWSKTSEKDSKIAELEKALKEQEDKYNESVKEIRDKIEAIKGEG